MSAAWLASSSRSQTTHQGLRKGLAEVLPEAAWQPCYVHFLRNALDHVSRKVLDDCLKEVHWLYARRNSGEA